MKGFVDNIERLTENNENFRQVLHGQKPTAGADENAAR